jgi:energy-converting hydrogenase B subunit Q
MSNAFDITTKDEPGSLQSITEAISNANANIGYIGIGEKRKGKAKIYLELDELGDPDALEKELSELDAVLRIKQVPTFSEVYGKRVIIVGGGAQIAEVAKGAISEADRHNIRGEKISVDSIPLVGEDKIEKAVRGVGRLSRAEVLVLAGSIMGGNIKEAVEEIREIGVTVISLKMAGSVPEACDLVVSDPLQAGVMAVMAISDNAEFDLAKQRGKTF